MRVLVMGTGAVGGYFGGKLARAGEDVTFVARGRQLQALQAHGLTIRSYRGDFALPVRVVGDPSAAGTVDLVLFCVKSYDTEAAAAASLPALGPASMVLSVQNGVDNEEKIAAVVRSEQVLGGAAYLFAEAVEPGVIQHTATGRIVLGEVVGGTTERAAELAERFRQADVPCEVTADIAKVKWTKLIVNAALNALTTLARSDIARVLACSESRQVLVDTMREVGAVARARGVPVDADAEAAALTMLESLGPVGSSMLQDLERGRRLESEALNGVVVRLGEEAGIPTPVNRVLYGCLKLLDPPGPTCSP